MKKNAFLLILLTTFLMAGCASLKNLQTPYCATGEMVFNKNTGTGWCYDFSFENRMDKTVRCVDFVLSLFDYDGEPVFEQDWIRFRWEKFVAPENLEKGSVILDEYFVSEPECEWLTEYFYASRIEYEDGSVFEDPFGKNAN